jgi:hypothetical protein
MLEYHSQEPLNTNSRPLYQTQHQQPGIDQLSSRMKDLAMAQQYNVQDDYQHYAFQPSHNSYYPQQFESYAPSFSVETMHGMPGYPGRPPVSRSNQTSPMNPPSQAYSRPSTAGGYGMWASPPMSPAPMQYRHSRQQSYVDEFGGVRGMQNVPLGGMPMPPQDGRSMYYNTAPSAWTTPSTVSAPFFSPYQPNTPTMEPHIRSWSSRAHRQSFTAPLQNTPEKERKAYHPQPPSRRSDWVMWVGNV